jgi:hypothetical protein
VIAEIPRSRMLARNGWRHWPAEESEAFRMLSIEPALLQRDDSRDALARMIASASTERERQ